MSGVLGGMFGEVTKIPGFRVFDDGDGTGGASKPLKDGDVKGPAEAGSANAGGGRAGGGTNGNGDAGGVARAGGVAGGPDGGGAGAQAAKKASPSIPQVPDSLHGSLAGYADPAVSPGSLRPGPTPGILLDAKGDRYIELGGKAYHVRFDRDSNTWRVFNKGADLKPQYCSGQASLDTHKGVFQ